MSGDAIYEPVVTRLPEALQAEAEAMEEARQAAAAAEAKRQTAEAHAAEKKATKQAADEAKGYAEDTERLKRESE